MKLDDFMDALGQVEDRYVVSAGKRAAKRKRRWNMWLTATAAVLVLAIGAGALATGKLGSGRPEAGTDGSLFMGGSAGGGNADSTDSAGNADSATSLMPPEAPVEAPQAVEPAAPPGDAPVTGEDGLPCDGINDAVEEAAPEDEGDFVKLTGAKLLAAPFYPSRVARTEDSYAQWAAEQEQLALSNDAAAVFRPYLAKTLPALLKTQGGENTVCTPMNLYLALSMLAEAAGGDSRQQILDLLGEEDLEAIRAQASRMWNALYMADGASHLELASSLWLRAGMTYNQQVLQSLAANYFASAYSGTPGTPALDAALQAWINEHTDNLLEQLQVDPSTVLALVSAVSYQDSWLMGFSEDTTEGMFHTPGGDVPAMLMHTTLPACPLWQTDNFTAIQLELANSQMLLILPNEGTAPEDLLEDPDAIALLSGETFDAAHTTAVVSLALPRFDVHASAELKETLQSLAVSDVFDPTLGNFDPLEVRFEDGTPDTIAVSRVLQAARVSIDETGCLGAGFVYVEMTDGALLPEEQGPVALAFDRPFLFAVLKEDLPVFAGIVNIP